MLEDMAMRCLREDTQRDYIRSVKNFANFLGRSPDTATGDDVRRYQVHQHENGAQPPTINSSVSALRFFFTITLDRPASATPHRVKTLIPRYRVPACRLGITGPPIRPAHGFDLGCE